MGKPVPKAVTAAPKKQAKVQVVVKAKATGKPLAGVPGLLLGNSDGKAFTRNLGKTDGLGRFKFVTDLGLRELQIRHRNHAGEGFATLPTSPDTTIVFAKTLDEGSHEFTVSMVQIRAQVTVAVTDAADGAALGGVRVKRGSETGLTDKNGNYVTTALDMGQKHVFELTRNGHGPESGTAIGPVTGIVDLTGLTEVADQKLPLKMKNQWGKVKSEKIEPESKNFPVWFSEFAAPFPKEHPTLKIDGKPAKTFPFAPILAGPSGTAAFNQLFKDMASWSGGPLTIEEFVAIFMIISNETGGTYKPVSEKGSLAYMFYLNKGPNRLAGDLLAERGKLTAQERILAWNKKGSANFPGVGTDGITEADLKECDFWKYRGRGFVQTTLRTLYLDRVDPVLKAAGLNISDDLTADDLDKEVLTNDKVYYPLLSKEIATRRSSLVRANAEEWKPFGYAVAGVNNHDYAALYEWRCQEVYKALRTAAEAGKLSLS